MYKDRLLNILKTVFDRENTICRIIAAWCSFVATTLLMTEGEFKELSFAQDISLSKMALYIVAFFIMYSVVSYCWSKYYTDSWFLLLSSTVCVVKWLLVYEHPKNEFLFSMAVIAVYALFVIYCLRRNAELLAAFQPSKRMTMIFAIFCGVVSCTVISVITVLRYKTFMSPNFDFGLFCNMFHYMKETGLPLVTSERNQLLSHFAVHISPIYYLLLPFYYIFPSPITLQVGQAVVLASGVVPVVLLCNHFKISGKATMLVALIYSFYPAISAGCFYDIHENCFLAPLLLWTFYFFERQKWIPMYVFALGVLFVKEDAAMYILIFALYVLLSRRNYKHGTILAVGSLAYFGFALWLLTKFGTGVMVNRFDNLIFNAEEGLLGAVKTALLNPGFLLTQLFTTGGSGFDKFIYAIQMLLPIGLLPFCTRKPSKWLLITPILMNLLTMYQYQYDLSFQYQFGITAFLIYAMISNINELKLPTRKTLVSIGAIACCCFYMITVIPTFNYYTKVWKQNKEIYVQMEEILDTIPEDASLNVSTFLLAHVADREYVYEIDYHEDKPDVDYVIFDDRWSSASDTKHKRAYLEQGYVVAEEYDGLIVILKRAG